MLEKVLWNKKKSNHFFIFSNSQIFHGVNPPNYQYRLQHSQELLKTALISPIQSGCQMACLTGAPPTSIYILNLDTFAKRLNCYAGKLPSLEKSSIVGERFAIVVVGIGWDFLLFFSKLNTFRVDWMFGG